MADSLTQVQKDFVILLKQHGCSLLETLAIASRMGNPLNLADMLEYMLDNPNSTPAQLYETCLRISSRRPNPEIPES